jgi:beta-glucosidase
LVECKMEAGKKYAVKLEYFVNRDDEICQLFWETPTVENTDKYAEDLKAARESDYVIAVLGINKLTEREGIDRKTIDLPLDQTNYLKEIYKENKNVIVVLIAGSSLAINWIDENIPAIVEGWYPGESGGTAIADVLFGDYNPGGRLPFTFYKSTDDLPAFDDYDIYKGRTYLYFGGKPLYPFGYGLSFTNFKYSKPSISKGDDKIVITADIKNTGKLNGDEVVQLYCTDVKSSVKRPIKQLVDFTRISLEAGETKRISLTVTKDQLKYWDVTTNRFVFESGEFAFTLGSSSQNERLKKVIEIN